MIAGWIIFPDFSTMNWRYKKKPTPKRTSKPAPTVPVRGVFGQKTASPYRPCDKPT
jgi:hypothetical protein